VRSQRLRPHLTYANVTSTLALFLVIAGGAAFAASAPKNSVTSKSIRNGAVKSVDVADNGLTGADIDESSFSTAPSGAAGGSLRGTYPSPSLGPNSVGSTQIQTDAVTADELADNSVSGDNVVPNSLGGAVIADGSLNSADIQDQGILAADLAPGSVGPAAITDFSLGGKDVVTDADVLPAGLPSIPAHTCNTDLQPNPAHANHLTDSVITVTPSLGFSGPFTVTPEVQSDTVFAIKICNVSNAAADPDGAESALYDWAVIDPTP
jgi:hypothetical protein